MGQSAQETLPPDLIPAISASIRYCLSLRSFHRMVAKGEITKYYKGPYVFYNLNELDRIADSLPRRGSNKTAWLRKKIPLQKQFQKDPNISGEFSSNPPWENSGTMKEQAPKRILPPNNKLIPPPVQVSVWKVEGKLFESPKAAIEAWKAIVGNSLVSMIEKNLNHLNSLFGEENS